MNEPIFFIIAGACIFLMLAIATLYIYHRNILKKKNMNLFHRLKEQDLLAKELEHTQVEKELLVKILLEKL